MQYWPKELQEYDFSPGEVEAITGVSHAKQRQWRVRYLDFRQAHFVHHEPYERPERATWTFEGVQLIALFARALDDLGDGDLARRVLMLDQKPNQVRNELDIFHSDQRAIDGEDLFIGGDLAREEVRFDTSGARDLHTFVTPSVPFTSATPRAYLINFSAFQRDLFDKAMAVISKGSSR